MKKDREKYILLQNRYYNLFLKPEIQEWRYTPLIRKAAQDLIIRSNFKMIINKPFANFPDIGP